MPNISVLVPDATTNYIKNPSFRNNTTGWTASGAAVARTYTRARFGYASVMITPNGSLQNEGMYYRVINMPVGEVTASIYLRGSGTVRIRLYDAAYGEQWYSKSIALTDNRWQRISTTGTSIGGNDMRLYVETADYVQTAPFYADGAQMEPKAYPTTYCDGDQPDCRWNIISNSSISTRPAWSRLGGKWIVLAGPCRTTANDKIYMTTMSGFGMPPMSLNTQSYAQLPGSFFQSAKIEPRPVSMLFHTINKQPRAGKPKLDALHELRQQLIDIFKPDRGANQEPFLFEYEDGDRPLYLWMRYEAGLEGDWDIRNRWYNQFPLRMLATDPFFYEDNQETAELGINQSFEVNLVLGRKDGEWSNLNYGFETLTNGVRTGLRGPDGAVYMGGHFYFGNHDATAIDPDIVLGGRGYWDGTQWQKMSTVGGASPDIHSMCVAPDGNIYVCGTFASIGNNAPAAVNVARWDGSTWYALGSGLNGTGRAIVAHPNGDIYVGGDFTTPGKYIARWDGSSWHGLGATGLNGPVHALAFSANAETLYIGGDFDDEYTATSATLENVCSYSPSTNTFSAMGAGVNNIVNVILLANDSTPYIGGEFTASNDVHGTQVMYCVAKFNGTNWERLGDGLRGGSCYGLAWTEENHLAASGWFTSAGGLSYRADNIAFWNGSNWYPAPLIPDVGANANIKAFVTGEAGDWYIGSATSLVSPLVSKVTTVTNSGSATAYPKIYVLGYGILRWLENVTTGKRVVLNLEVLNNEEVCIDFGAGTITSNTRGNMLHTLYGGSDFRSFSLLPGENRICVFMHDDVGAQAHMLYTPSHWSADASAREEEM